jgi:hypothetical protein
VTTHLLLTGAGFTYNWGGWLAKELEGDLLGRLTSSPALHSLVQNATNFEEALDTARRSLASDQARALEAAIKDSFKAMNAALAQRFSMFLSGKEYVVDFLARFDAIFTLNQDLLLEIHYSAHREGSRWKGTYYPGIIPPTLPVPTLPSDKSEVLHRARRVGAISAAEESRQPIYKLHGSVDWTDDSGDLLVVGGGKDSYIESKPLLGEYFRVFRERLLAPNTRLMIIGYGWGDDHVNRVIFDAAKSNHSLGLFHVNPNGRDAISGPGGEPIVRYSTSTLAPLKCVGESRRALTTTFGGDNLEYEKLMRFFVQ